MTEDGNWTVRSNTNDNDRRVYYAGNEADVRDWVERNFPRPHVDQNSDAVPEVFLQAPDGARHSFMNGEWTAEKTEVTTSRKRGTADANA